MDTPPLTGCKGELHDTDISDITLPRRQALPTTIYAPDMESVSTAVVTDSGLYQHGVPASQATIFQDPRRPRTVDHPLHHYPSIVVTFTPESS